MRLGFKGYYYAQCRPYHSTAARKPAKRKDSSEKRKTPARTGMQQQKCRERDMACVSVDYEAKFYGLKASTMS